jgi:aldehyde:ferredoxin oxidoreductase
MLLFCNVRSLKAAKIIGRESEKYAFTTKGMEMTMMPDPRASARRGWQFGFLTNPRGGDNVKNTHFYAERYNPNWWVDQFDMFAEVKEKIYSMPPEKVTETWQGKAMMCKWFEDLYSICNALGFCLFTVGSDSHGVSPIFRNYFQHAPAVIPPPRK